MSTGKATNRKYRIVTAAFLLLAAIGGVFYYAEVKHSLQRVEMDREKSTEFSRMAPPGQAVDHIRMSELVANRNNLVIIDVREPEEYALGRLKGSLHYRLGELLNSEQVRRDMIEQSGDKIRVFYCHDGDRSTLAASIIQSEFGGANVVMERGYRQIHENEKYRAYWEGSSDLLPAGTGFEETAPVLKWSDVTAGTLIELSLPYRPPLRRARGKTIIHAPILLMSNAQIDALIATLGTEPVIALCNSKVSCFSTQIFRHRLEQRGLKLSGFVWVRTGAS